LYVWDDVNSAGAINLADALKYNTTLESLGLDGSNIGNEGAVALAKALKYNNTLKILELNNCNIDDVGGVALAEVLKVNKTLEILQLDRNNIGDTGGQALAEALKYNNTLTHLELHENPIDYFLIDKIDKMVINNLKNFEAKKKKDNQQKQIEYLSTLRPPQVSPYMPCKRDRGVGLFIVGKEPGHESSAYGTCYILKSRLGVERCEFIYTERPTEKGDRITGGNKNLELLIQLEEKLIHLIESGYTHLYLFMECHGGSLGYCSHELNVGGAFTINLLIEVWQKYYDRWKSAIFICDSCASNLLIDEANLPHVNAKNIIGFGVPGNCDNIISKGQLRIIKAITFSALHRLILNPLMDIKTFLDLLKTTWDVWRDSNLKPNDDYFEMEIFYSDLDESEVSLKICNPQNLNTSGDYEPLAYALENQLGPNNSAFNAGWKPLIFWWLTTPFNDINDVEELMIQQYISNRYSQGNDIKIFYNGTKGLIETALEMSKQNKTISLQTKINLLHIFLARSNARTNSYPSELNPFSEQPLTPAPLERMFTAQDHPELIRNPRLPTTPPAAAPAATPTILPLSDQRRILDSFQQTIEERGWDRATMLTLLTPEEKAIYE